MKKRGLWLQKMGLIPSKNWIRILRPAINEWRPKKGQQNEVVIWSCRKMSFGNLISIYLGIFVTYGHFWQKQKTYRNFHRSIANGYVNTVKLNSPNLVKIYIYTYVFHHVYEFIELFMQPFGFFSKPPSSKYENRLFV